MKGMTLEEYAEVVEFVQNHHPFAKSFHGGAREWRKRHFPKLPAEYGFGIKYIDNCYDSRDGKVWSITFRQGRHGVCFRCNHFNALNPPPKKWKYDNLYDLCMAWLKGEFREKAEFQIDIDKG